MDNKDIQELVKQLVENEIECNNKVIFYSMMIKKAHDALHKNLKLYEQWRYEACDKYDTQAQELGKQLRDKLNDKSVCLNCKHVGVDNQMCVYYCKLEDNTVAFDALSEDEMLKFVNHSCEKWCAK